MSSLIARWVIAAIAIALTIQIVPGIRGNEFGNAGIDLPSLLAVAFIFGLINAIVRPILKFLSCPFIILTLGLFVFVINAAMLLLTSAIATSLGLQFYVDGFGAALAGAIIISLVSIVLNLFIRSDKDDHK